MTMTAPEKSLFDTPENIATEQDILDALAETQMVFDSIEKQVKKQKKQKGEIKRLLKKQKKAKKSKKGLLKRFWAALKRKVKSALTKARNLFAKIGRGIKKSQKRLAKYLAGKGILPSVYRALRKAVVYVGTPLVVAARWVYQGAAMAISGVSLAVVVAVATVAGVVIYLVTLPFKDKKKSKKSKKAKAKKVQAKVESVDADTDEERARAMLGDDLYEKTVEYVKAELGVEDVRPPAQQPKGRPTPKRPKADNRRHHGPRTHTPRPTENSDLPPF